MTNPDPAIVAEGLTEAQRKLLIVDGVIAPDPRIPEEIKAAWGLEGFGLIQRRPFVFGFYYDHSPIGLAVKAHIQQGEEGNG